MYPPYIKQMNAYWKTDQIKQYLQINHGLVPSYSQLGQDVAVVEKYQGRENGYYVDVGAYDGICFSNTYLLEKKYHWTGLCIEPEPFAFQQLCLNRPQSKCINHAVYSVSDLDLNFSVNDMLSGISCLIDYHQEKPSKIIPIKTVRLSELLDQSQAPSWIEYLSIDTEGTELEVLMSIDYQRYTFGLIHVEHNGVQPRRDNMRKLLLSKGYIYARENQWDDEYIYPSTPF